MSEEYKLISRNGHLYLCDQVTGRDQFGNFSVRLLALVHNGRRTYYPENLGLSMELVGESNMSIVGIVTDTPREIFCYTDEILDCPGYLVLDYKHLTNKFRDDSFATEDKIRNSKPEIPQEYSIGGLVV